MYSPEEQRKSHEAQKIKRIAEEEIAEENLRKKVDAMKEKLRAHRWWHRFIPRITITWRNT